MLALLAFILDLDCTRYIHNPSYTPNLYNASLCLDKQRSKRLAHSDYPDDVRFQCILYLVNVDIQRGNGVIPSGVVHQVVQLPTGDFRYFIFEIVHALVRSDVHRQDCHAEFSEVFDDLGSSCCGDDMVACIKYAVLVHATEGEVLE